MNLREQIEKEITEKVMVKLASKKVELGLIQDFLKDITKGLSKGKEMKKYAKEVSAKNEQLNKLETLYNKTIKEHSESDNNFTLNRDSIISSYTRAAKIYTKLINNASDLGIDVPAKVEKSFKEIDDLYNFQKNAYAKNASQKRKEI